MISFAKLVIGILLLRCLYNWDGPGTITYGFRFIIGLTGAWLVIPSKCGVGSLGFLLVGLVGYIWLNNSGNLYSIYYEDLTLISIDGVIKSSLRLVSVITLILGWNDLKK